MFLPPGHRVLLYLIFCCCVSKAQKCSTQYMWILHIALLEMLLICNSRLYQWNQSSWRIRLWNDLFTVNVLQSVKPCFLIHWSNQFKSWWRSKGHISFLQSIGCSCCGRSVVGQLYWSEGYDSMTGKVAVVLVTCSTDWHNMILCSFTYHTWPDFSRLMITMVALLLMINPVSHSSVVCIGLSCCFCVATHSTTRPTLRLFVRWKRSSAMLDTTLNKSRS